MEKLSIRVMIGNRTYSMKPKITRQRERSFYKELNKKIKDVSKKMNIEDLPTGVVDWIGAALNTNQIKELQKAITHYIV